MMGYRPGPRPTPRPAQSGQESDGCRSTPGPAPARRTSASTTCWRRSPRAGWGRSTRAATAATGEIVAIKVIPPTTAKNPVLLKRFEQEFRAAAALDHPNIVRALDFCGTGPTPFLVMEFVDGESLGAKVEREGPMPEDEAIRLIAQVCQGLHRAHKQKLIHRDVKPDNILVTADGVAKLTDLGLVKDAEDDLNLTKTGRGLGTPHYMAPEQFRNAKNVDVRCDIYSLGATLYTLVTGEIPFGKVGPLDCWMARSGTSCRSPREVNPEVSERVNWAILRAMSGDPDQRPASCQEFVEDLTGASLRPAIGPGRRAAAGRPVVPGLPGREGRDAHGQGDDRRHPQGPQGRAARGRVQRPGQPDQARASSWS